VNKKISIDYHEAEQFEFNFTPKNQEIKVSLFPVDEIRPDSEKNSPRSSRKPKTSDERKLEREYYRLKFWENRVVSRKLYDYVQKNVFVPNRDGYREFFWYLVLNLHRQHFDDILVGGVLIAAFLNRSTKSKAAKASRFLESFNREVMVPMGSVLKTGEYNYVQGKSRATKEYHFGKHEQAMDDLLLEPLTDLVFIKDGSSANKSDLVRIEKECLDASLLVEKLYPLPDEVIFIQNYLNKLPSNFFTGLVKLKIYQARQMVKFLDLKEQAVKMQYAFLNSIERSPLPQYQQSLHGKSVRLYSGSSIAALTRKLRRFFLADSPEGDLKCAQLAIGSVLFDYPKIHEFLSDPKNNGDIWREIIPEWVDPEDFDFVKDHVKEATYSVQYTMERGAVYFILLGKLEPQFGYNSNVLASHILQHWVFQEMFECVGRFVERLNNGLEVTDAYGRIYRLSEKLNTGALMACVAQSYETKMLYPAFEYVASKSNGTKKDRIRIILFQFDGFNIWARDKKYLEFYKQEISDAVIKGIESCEHLLGKRIPIKFEWKENKTKETKENIKEIKSPLLVPHPLCKFA